MICDFFFIIYSNQGENALAERESSPEVAKKTDKKLQLPPYPLGANSKNDDFPLTHILKCQFHSRNMLTDWFKKTF